MITKFKRGSIADHLTYVGPEGSFSVVTETGELRVHDGVTPGGWKAEGLPPYPDDPVGIYGIRNKEWVRVNAEIVESPLLISASGNHGYALVNGEVYSVGVNGSGQLGLGNTSNRGTWTPTGLTGVTAIAAGNSHGYAVVDGEVYSVGSNSSGQLGLGDTDDRNTWTPTGLTNVTAIAAGSGFGYALVDGEVYSVGSNGNGRLGLGDTTARNTWTPTGLTSVTAIAAGYSHGYALVDGEVYSVGYNWRGRLGLGDTTNRNTWTPTGLTSVTAIVAGSDSSYGHGYALVDGEVYSVGSNSEGQLSVGRIGTGNYNTRWTPTGLTNVTAIAAGSQYGYALVDGEVYFVGRLGSGSRRNTWTPNGLTNVTAIAAGSSHGYALVDGEVYSVGQNSSGQLGLGDTTSRSIWTPTGFPS